MNTFDTIVEYIIKKAPIITPEISKLLDSIEQHYKPPLTFINKYSMFLSPADLSLFNNIDTMQSEWEEDNLSDDDGFDEFESDYFSSDEYIEIEERLIEGILQNINILLIKYKKQTATYCIDGGQSGWSDDVTLIITLDDITTQGTAYKTDNDYITIYHVSNINNKNKILRNGILPRAAFEGGISYEPRIFFYIDLPDEDKLKEYSIMFQGKPGVSLAGARKPDKISDVTVYTIKIPTKNFKIYKDTSTEKGWYTNKKIPPKYIIDYRDIQLSE